MYVGRLIRLFLHIGSEIDVAYDDIVAVINVEKDNRINSEFIERLSQSGDCVVLDNKIRSAIISYQNNRTKIFLSSVSTVSIKKRIAGFYKFSQ